jgi:hypothetical protein
MSQDLRTVVTFEPGQLITAESMNAMQDKILAAIEAQIAAAIKALAEVPGAEDAQKLGGATAEELLDRFMERAMQEIPSRTGYRKLFKVLEVGKINLVRHELAAHPLVDLYELMPFEVICAHDELREVHEVRFYLYHSSERRIRTTVENQPDPISVVIEDDDPPFRIAMSALLDLFDVPYTEKSSLGDLETELWKAMFADPNDEVDAEQLCHSPWYERCCREERRVSDLKERGEWDDLWLKVKPQKTDNLMSSNGGRERPSPYNVRVDHRDLDNLTLTFTHGRVRDEDQLPDQTLFAMVLLKV